MKSIVKFSLNGKAVQVEADGERPLLWVLRTDLGLTGSKYGCGEGLCGSCTVLIDKEAVRSCQIPLSYVTGKEVITIEGLAGNGNLHPLQKAFIEQYALQCGFCTPGMIMNAYGLLLSNPRPTREEIIDAMEENLCRCGSYTRIIEAIDSASKAMEGVG